jgi:hypothetical protein
LYLSSKHAEMHSNTLLLPFYWRKMPVFDTSIKIYLPRRHVIVVATCFLVRLNIILAIVPCTGHPWPWRVNWRVCLWFSGNESLVGYLVVVYDTEFLPELKNSVRHGPLKYQGSKTTIKSLDYSYCFTIITISN